jgi:hypothetical protein
MRKISRSLVTVFGASLLLLGGLAAPATANEEGDAARGTVKIEDSEFGDAENPNEVKVGCDFSIEFYGMDRGTVPVTFTLMPPSGEDVIAERRARVQAAQGNELSGTLEVDLSDELADVTPAQAEDFDYKVRVDAEVKSTKGNDSITKSAILFIICETAAGDADLAGEEGTTPLGGVEAGYGGTANTESSPPVYSAAVAAVVSVLTGVLLLTRRLRRHGV